jgi:hypothetical protein
MQVYACVYAHSELRLMYECICKPYCIACTNTNSGGRAAWGGLGTKRSNGQSCDANAGNGQNRNGHNRSASAEDRKVVHGIYVCYSFEYI